MSDWMYSGGESLLCNNVALVAGMSSGNPAAECCSREQ
jgi:hypothetical protein